MSVATFVIIEFYTKYKKIKEKKLTEWTNITRSFIHTTMFSFAYMIYRLILLQFSKFNKSENL